MAGFKVNVIGKNSKGGTVTRSVPIYDAKTEAEAIQKAKAMTAKNCKDFVKIIGAIAKKG